MCHLQMILSCRGDRHGRLDTLNIKIRPLFQEIKAEQVGCKIRDRRRNGTAGQPPVLYVLDNTGSCPAVPPSVSHKFYIQLALPISPEIMDGF